MSQVLGNISQYACNSLDDQFKLFKFVNTDEDDSVSFCFNWALLLSAGIDDDSATFDGCSTPVVGCKIVDDVMVGCNTDEVERPIAKAGTLPGEYLRGLGSSTLKREKRYWCDCREVCF